MANDIQPTDLSKITAGLSQLETVVQATVKARRQITDKYRNPNHPLRQLELAQLETDATEAMERGRAAIAEAFDAAKTHAAKNIAAARADYSRSPEGREEITALPGMAALAGALTANQLAERLNGLIDSGLIGQARALAAVSTSKATDASDHKARGALLAAIHRAETEAVSPMEAAVAAEAAYIEHAAQNFHAFSAQGSRRITHALETGQDYAPDNFTTHVFPKPTQEGGR